MIAEERVVLSELPAVSVPAPSAKVPDRAPTVWLLPLRSNVPPVIRSALPACREAPVASCRVPPFTIVPPL